MNPLPVQTLRMAIFAVRSLLTPEQLEHVNVHLLQAVIVDGGRNQHALLNRIQTRLRDVGRHDLVNLLTETRNGDFTLLEEISNTYLPNRNLFHGGSITRNHLWPQIFYSLSNNNNPVTTESETIGTFPEVLEELS